MLWFIIGILCIAIDSLTKLYISNNFMTGQTIPVINRVFHITYHINDGAAFSILRGKTVFLAVCSIVIICGIFVYIFVKKPKDNLLLFSLTLVISGAAGNLIDRLFRGGVIDFFDFRLINFPVFNVADCFVVVGGILLFMYAMKSTKGEN